MALLPYQRYYTSVRAITRVGNVLESHSDGFVVDTTAPSLTITSVGGEPLNSSVDVMYWIEPEYFSAAWEAGDTESGIGDVWYHMGTYPGRKETYGSSLFYKLPCIVLSNTSYSSYSASSSLSSSNSFSSSSFSFSNSSSSSSLYFPTRPLPFLFLTRPPLLFLLPNCPPPLCCLL